MKSASVQSPIQPHWSRRSGLYFVLLFGAVNLFADMTYEGARSVTGPFLGMLGASGFIVGTVTGFGEFLGYALRLVSGRWADRSRLYWPITVGGYIVQMVAVPALALSGTWPIAATLILLPACCHGILRCRAVGRVLPFGRAGLRWRPRRSASAARSVRDARLGERRRVSCRLWRDTGCARSALHIRCVATFRRKIREPKCWGRIGAVAIFCEPGRI
jgi:hypothetical protein